MTPEMTPELVARGRAKLTPNYNPAPVVFERGEGVWLIDRDGKRYLDFAAGIAVNSLGHNHPRLTQAIAEQARNLLHVSNLFFTEPAIQLAERLTEISFADRVYFGNSGAEANEAAFKLARRYSQIIRGENRWKFICANQSFHGRTWAAISATGQPKYHKGFGPLVPGFEHVDYGDLDAFAAAIDDETCAVLIEPIQGEGGVLVPSPGFLPKLRALCDERGVLLIYDEVQTGVGRTGDWFAYQDEGAAPDIMTLAKGLGGGVPIGAMLCTETVAPGFQPGVHASTFGGNPLACRAGLTVLDVIAEDNLVHRAREVGEYMAEKLAGLSSIPGVGEVRGRGLMRGLAVDPEVVDRGKVRSVAMKHGLLLTQAGPDALRLTPPLIVSEAHVDDAVERLRTTLQEVVS